MTLPRNYGAVPKIYNFYSGLKGSALNAHKTTVTVAAALPSVSSFTADPQNLPYRGGDVNLMITGENLNNYTALEIREGANIHPISGLGQGTDTTTYKVTPAKNTTPSPKSYTYELYDSGASLNQSVTVTVAAAVPGIDSLTAKSLTAGAENDPGGRWVVLEDTGGLIDFTIEGLNMHNYTTLDIVSSTGTPTASPVVLNGDEQDNTQGSSAVSVPANRTMQEQVYVFELTRSGGTPTGHKVTVTVKKPDAGITSIAAQPARFSSDGGTSRFTIQGKLLDITAIELRDRARGTVYPVTDISSDGSSGTVSLGFSGQGGGKRNDIYELEGYFGGVATGVYAKVEVGDSNPYFDSADASPSQFSQREAQEGRARTTLTIRGGYLYNYGAISVYDEILDRTYQVDNAKHSGDDSYHDETVTLEMTMPRNEGEYPFRILIDGAETGTTVYIRVGNVLGGSGGTSPGTPEPTQPEPADEREWTGRGGGAKGGAFQDPGQAGYSVLKYLVQQAVAQAPQGQTPVVVLTNISYISQTDLDNAASGARLESGTAKLRFETTYAADPTRLMGSLTLNPNEITGDLYPGVYNDDTHAAATLAAAQREFDNENLDVVHLVQNGVFGGDTEVTAVLDISVEEAVYVYRLDRNTGNYTQVAGAYVNEAGQVCFTTTQGGDFIVSDQPLQKGGVIQKIGKLDLPDLGPKKDEE